MVRLKGMAEALANLAKGLFQFQNGSIKSNWILATGNWNMSFQFQNGSIKRNVSLAFKCRN